MNIRLNRHLATSGLVGLLTSVCLPAAALAAPLEPVACAKVRLASPGWTDIDATNALLGLTLKALGYQSEVKTLSVPMAYQGLRSGQLDAFLGNWMPAQTQLVEPLIGKHQIDVLGANLEHARFTLAVPAYTAQAGIRSFADLNAHADEFSRKIYGIEAGAPANEVIKKMISANAFGLGGWTLVESSDTGLLSQVTHDIRAKKAAVFLAWEPHVMNTRFQITYLKGGDEFFGADTGSASVRTVSRTGYAAQCGNVGRLLSQLKFTVELENQLIELNTTQRQDLDTAARTVLKQNPALWRSWLNGVTTRDGGDAAGALQKLIGS